MQLRKEARQRAFLAAFKQLGSIRAACKAAGIYHTQHYAWMDSDSEYVQAFEKIEREAIDDLEQRAIQRAREGVEEYIPNPHTGIVYDSNGKPIVNRKFNEQLTIAVLRARKPERYREDRHLEITGPNGAPLFSKPEINVALVKEVTMQLDSATVPALPEPHFEVLSAAESEEESDAESSPMSSSPGLASS